MSALWKSMGEQAMGLLGKHENADSGSNKTTMITIKKARNGFVVQRMGVIQPKPFVCELVDPTSTASLVRTRQNIFNEITAVFFPMLAEAVPFEKE
ncbi:MAG: hypothetical protein V1800_06755 [Candidatus Latescibacterota bacterium]